MAITKRTYILINENEVVLAVYKTKKSAYAKMEEINKARKPADQVHIVERVKEVTK